MKTSWLETPLSPVPDPVRVWRRPGSPTPDRPLAWPALDLREALLRTFRAQIAD